MKKNFIKTTALMLAVMLLFTGCSSTAGAPAETPEQSASVTTRTVTDMLGREVTIPIEVKTVAVAGSSARLMTYAGCADKIVGVTDMDKKPAESMPYSYVNKDKFASLTPVGAGGSKDSQYTEALVTLAPEIIISNYLDKAGADELQAKTNIPVIGLTSDGIFSDSVFNAIALIGEVMGTQDHCTEVITAMKEWQSDLNDRTKDIPDADKKTVYAGAVSFKGGHGIDGTYGKYPPFVAVNAKNVVDETDQNGFVQIDKEKLVVWDPDIIFLNPANMNMVNEDYASNKNFYDNLKAVKSGNVYSQVSYNYNGTNIELAIADAYYAGMIICPEKFSDLDFEETADEIFNIMLGQSYLQVLKDSGNGFEKIKIGE